MILERGDHGQFVRLLQLAIGVDADGAFGGKTAAAVDAKRRALGLVAGEFADDRLLDAIGCGVIRGADFSHHNGVIDFARVRAAGIRFCWVKCTQNDGNVDPMFGANVAAARKAGILVGAYHFAVAGRGDAAAEATWFLRCVGSLARLDLPPVLDLESNPGALNPADLSAWADAWRGYVRDACGIDPLLYTGMAFLHDKLAGGRLLAKGWRLWIARYLGGGAVDPCVEPYTDLGAFDGFTVWQYSQGGRVDGCGGAVDLNYLAGGEAALSSLCAKFYADGLFAPGN